MSNQNNYCDLNTFERLMESEPDACVIIEENTQILNVEDSMFSESHNFSDASEELMRNMEIGAFVTVNTISEDEVHVEPEFVCSKNTVVVTPDLFSDVDSDENSSDIDKNDHTYFSHRLTTIPETNNELVMENFDQFNEGEFLMSENIESSPVASQTEESIVIPLDISTSQHEFPTNSDPMDVDYTVLNSQTNLDTEDETLQISLSKSKSERVSMNKKLRNNGKKYTTVQ